MNDLRIATMSVTATSWPDPEQVPRMLRHLADEGLELALREHPLAEGEWCVRRLDVAVALDPERPSSAVEAAWADRLVEALHRCLTGTSGDVVHFARTELAVDDLLTGLARGRSERAWAWRQVGVLRADDPDPASDARAVFLQALERLAVGRAATVLRVLRRVGLGPVHRLLGRDGWAAAAALVAREFGVAWVDPLLTNAVPPIAAGSAAAESRGHRPSP